MCRGILVLRPELNKGPHSALFEVSDNMVSHTEIGVTRFEDSVGQPDQILTFLRQVVQGRTLGYRSLSGLA